MKKSKQKKIRRAASNIMLVCLLAIAALSLYNIIKIVVDYSKNNAVYESVREDNTKNGEIDWDKLKETNPDVIGWLKLDSTKIDYPVVQGEDNDKYLHTLFDGSIGGCGTLFADCRHEKPFEETNTIIYGHHMRDGSMFHTLKNYRTSSYADEHPVFKLKTPDKDYDVLVTAFLLVRGDDSVYKTDFSSKEDSRNWINEVRSKATYLTEETMEEDDKFIMMSTCAGSSKKNRYIVVGKLSYRKQKQ